MSNSSQALTGEEGIEIRTFGVTFPHNAPRPLIPPRDKGWDQLVYASRGVMSVRAELHEWLVIPHRALWVPAAVPYEIRLRGEVALRSLYFRRTRGRPAVLNHCAALNITPLFRELALRAAAIGALDRNNPEHRSLIALTRDELRRLTRVSLQLPAPADPRAAKFASFLEAQLPEARPPLDRLCRDCGASQRTLDRIFRAETSMSLGRWIRRRDLLTAVGRLAVGERVSQVAEALGYNSPSAFIAMFRRELGQSPVRYLNSQSAR